MGRSGYNEDIDDTWSLICWRGAVASAIRGKRGQAFLREMLAALDALPDKRLVAHEIMTKEGEVCAIGAVALARGIDGTTLDPYDWSTLSGTFGVAEAMVREIEYENDDTWAGTAETPEARFLRVRRWIERQLIDWESA